MKCSYYRWRISLALDSDNPQAKLPHAHLARCPACRAFRAQAAAAADALAQEARPQARCVSEGSQARSVSEGTSIPAPAFKVTAARRWAVRSAGIAAAACVVVAIVVASQSGRPVRDQQIVGPAPVLPSHDRQLPTPQDAPPNLASAMPRVQMLADAATRPFVQEAQRTLADARAVGKALTSYLPIDTMAVQPKQDPPE